MVVGIDKNMGTDAIIGLIVGIAVLVIGFIIPGIGTIGIPNVPQSLSGDTAKFIVVVLLASIFETFFFFDIILSLIHEKLSNLIGMKIPFWMSASLASLAFSAFHLTAYQSFTSNSGAFFSAFLMGLVFSYERKLTNSNLPGIFTHGVLNWWIGFGSLSVILNMVLISGIKKHNKTTFKKGQKPWNKIEFTEEEIKLIKDSYANLESAFAISKKMGCSIYPIIRILKEENIPLLGVGMSGRKHSLETRQKIKDSLNEKFPNGRPLNKGCFKKGNIPIRHFEKGMEPHNKLKFSEKKTRQIISLYINELKSTNEIGKIFGCDEKPIRRILKENGIEFNQGKRMRKKFSGENSFSYKKLNDKKIIDLYLNGMSSYKISKLFNVSKKTILNRLNNKGIKIRNPGFRNRRRLKTEDGHIVRSSPELQIDNFLFNNSIKHIYEGYIADTKYLFDFYLPDFNIYIEYFGVEHNNYYKNKIKKKVEIYKLLGFNLLSIYPKDSIKQKLNIILEAKKQGINEIKII